MSDLMTFPKTWEEFERSYGFVDKDEVYTNGARLIPSFRVEQWMEHIQMQTDDAVEREYGRWFYAENEQGQDGYVCTKCGKFFPWIYKAFDIDFIKEFNYCPSCGKRMK